MAHPPPPAPSAAADGAESVLERVSSFVAENRRAVLLGAAAAAAVAAGAGYAYYASASRPAAGDGKKARKERKEKGGEKKKERAKRVGEDGGPLLEERSQPSAPASVVSAESEAEELTAEQVMALPEEDRLKSAADYKLKGNKAYQRRDFALAIKYYTQAIAVSPKPESVYYSNRAACYVNLAPPDHEKVVADCDAALALDRNYVKALNRRAAALEALGRNEEALRDYTAATILDKFQNEAAGQAVERVLKKIATEKAAAIMSTRERRLPSFTFVSAYFAAFRPRPPLLVPENPSTGDNTLVLATDALAAADYAHALTLVNEALAQGCSTDTLTAEALNLRGTFHFLTGDTDGALADLSRAVELHPAHTQSWVKLASVHMERGEPPRAFEAFEAAAAQNADDPDIYYHRGQVLFIMNEFGTAAEDYTRSSALDGSFVFAHIQLAVAQYKQGNLANAMATFRRTLKAFPDRSEPQNYYGELLLDQGRFQDAVEKFDRAIEIERTKTPMNVLPLVNKGLALFQWRQDAAAAERCCAEALAIDDACEAAVATLAQLSLQQGKIGAAVQMFERNAQLARNEPELVNALTYQFASYAQVEFMQNYPEMAGQLGQMAGQMV